MELHNVIRCGWAAPELSSSTEACLQVERICRMCKCVVPAPSITGQTCAKAWDPVQLSWAPAMPACATQLQMHWCWLPLTVRCMPAQPAAPTARYPPVHGTCRFSQPEKPSPGQFHQLDAGRSPAAGSSCLQNRCRPAMMPPRCHAAATPSSCARLPVARGHTTWAACRQPAAAPSGCIRRI